MRTPPSAIRHWAGIASLCTLLGACNQTPADYFPGYAEGDYVRLAAPIGGTLTRLYVKRGEQAEANAPAFVLEQESERAARDEAVASVARAEAQLADLGKGKRPDEIDAAQAQLAQAEAALQLSRADLQRAQQLVADKFISPSRLDEARAAMERDQANVAQLRAQLRVTKLAARPDEIAAARQAWKSAQAQLAQAEWKLDQKTQRIPIAARVDDVLYREGELVSAGSPIVSLLPPQNIKARFFVPESALGRLALGQRVTLHCDGCPAAITARISFIATAAEYTAPLIYSKETRTSLVFMVEAHPAPQDAVHLHPGQPLEVRLGAIGKGAP